MVDYNIGDVSELLHRQACSAYISMAITLLETYIYLKNLQFTFTLFFLQHSITDVKVINVIGTTKTQYTLLGKLYGYKCTRKM